MTDHNTPPDAWLIVVGNLLDAPQIYGPYPDPITAGKIIDQHADRADLIHREWLCLPITRIPPEGLPVVTIEPLYGADVIAFPDKR